jgi:ubiquitin C-terminal hydrolase
MIFCGVLQPFQLKKTISKKFPSLINGEQQDAQEFLSCFLNGLSEELTRRKKKQTKKNKQKNFIQIKDSNGRPDEQVALEWWVTHLEREPSLITALFTGQFKSLLVCDQCGLESARFEPFSLLQLPLQEEETKINCCIHPKEKEKETQDVTTVMVHFRCSPVHRPSLRMTFQIPHDCYTVGMLLKRIAHEKSIWYEKSNHEQDLQSEKVREKTLIAVFISNFIIEKIFDLDTLLKTIPSCSMDIYELFTLDSSTTCIIDKKTSSPDQQHIQQQTTTTRTTTTTTTTEEEEEEEEVVYLRFVHRRRQLVPFFFTNPFRFVLFGIPFIERIPVKILTCKKLYQMIDRRFQALYDDNEKLQEKEEEIPCFVLKRVRRDGKGCSRCDWIEKCDGCVIPRKNEKSEKKNTRSFFLELEMHETIAIEWLHDDIAIKVDHFCHLLENHESHVQHYMQKGTNCLEHCLEMFCAEEKLEAQCSHCNKKNTGFHPSSNNTGNTDNTGTTTMVFTPHTKHITLWSLPPVLVIQLKRFQFAGKTGVWQKLNNCIDFQLEGFDLQRFLSASSTQEEKVKRVTKSSDESSSSSSSNSTNVQDDLLKERIKMLREELNFPLSTASRTNTQYSLYGMVNHTGEIGGGHYTAIIKHFESNEWWLMDDADTIRIDPKTLSPSSASYLLFYIRQDLLPNDQSNTFKLRDFFPRQHGIKKISKSTLKSLRRQERFNVAKRKLSNTFTLFPKDDDEEDDDKEEDDGTMEVAHNQQSDSKQENSTNQNKPITSNNSTITTRPSRSKKKNKESSSSNGCAFM